MADVLAAPATPALDVDARGAPAERQRVAAAIVGLKTRSGTDRSHRVRYCAQAVAVVRDDPWATVAWRHQWCRDRACPACQRMRSRAVSTEIRRVVDEREQHGASLWFVTLTQPRIAGEPLRDAWDRYDAAWREQRDAMQDVPKDERTVLGGLRSTELAWKPGAGWHVHAHTIVELDDDGERVPCPACAGTQKVATKLRGGTYKHTRCRTCSSFAFPGDGTLPRDLASLLVQWAALVGGDVRAQCCVPCVTSCAGQLAKYIAAPLGAAASPAVWRELYDVAAGRRMHAPWGAWYRMVKLHRVDPSRRRWYPLCAVDALLRHPRAVVHFTTSALVSYAETKPNAYAVRINAMRMRPTLEPLDESDPKAWEKRVRAMASRVRRARNVDGRTWRPEVALGRMLASDVLRKLAADPRRTDEYDDLPDEVPRPFRTHVRAVSGASGPWALKRSGAVPLLYSDRTDEHERSAPDEADGCSGHDEPRSLGADGDDDARRQGDATRCDDSGGDERRRARLGARADARRLRGVDDDGVRNRERARGCAGAVDRVAELGRLARELRDPLGRVRDGTVEQHEQIDTTRVDGEAR